MKTSLVVLMTLLLLVGCAKGSAPTAGQLAPTSSNGPLTMTLSFDPSPLKRGNETANVTLKTPDGNPVKEASVKVTTSMPAMSMLGPSLVAQDNGDGSYSAVINLIYETKWIFDVTASSQGQTSSAKFSVEVK
jgi:hypothetical protein